MLDRAQLVILQKHLNLKYVEKAMAMLQLMEMILEPITMFMSPDLKKQGQPVGDKYKNPHPIFTSRMRFLDL